ncbi:MAG: Gfo/Idh/MocA family oxidoreductase [Victivallaceae bacterium]|nr:Gfo/Idh/MocA family oxidoreductase [Victivallaceae bacterium]
MIVKSENMKKNHSDHLRLGVIGVCRRGVLADIAHQPENGCQIVAGADIHQENLQKFTERFNHEVAAYTDYREMLEKENLDGVFIMSPDFCHEEHAAAALEKKVAVYLEKPMAITIAGCDRIMRAAFENRTKLFIGHNMRYMGFTKKMKEIIDSGLIGEVQAIWCRHFVSYGGDNYFKDWHAEQKYSTSLLLQKGCHDIDIIHWLAGSFTKTVTGLGKLSVYNSCEKSYPDNEYVQAKANPANWPPLEQRGMNPDMDNEDHNMILLQLGNGVQASYMQCFYTPDSCRNYTILGTKGRIENYGDVGEGATIEVWTNRSDSYRFNGDITYRSLVKPGGHGGADNKIVQNFIDYLSGKEKPALTPLAARYSVAAGYMGAMSIRAGGRPFDIPLPDNDIPLKEKYLKKQPLSE